MTQPDATVPQPVQSVAPSAASATPISGTPGGIVTIGTDARSAAIQAKLNTVLKIATPTYTLPDGSSVTVSAFFGMSGKGFRSNALSRNMPARDKLIATKKLRTGFAWARPVLADVQVLTQALIDGGNLPGVVVPNTYTTDLLPTTESLNLTSAARVRCMAYDFGVGIDCAGYAHQALIYPQPANDGGLYNLKSVDKENFMGLASNTSWQPVGVDGARPGDIMALSAASPTDVGHVITIYDHQVATAQADRDALAAPFVGLINSWEKEAVQALIASTSTLHLFVLDASWGAGGNPVPDGAGVQRRRALVVDGNDGSGHAWICQTRDGYFTNCGLTPWRDPFDNIYHPKGT